MCGGGVNAAIPWDRRRKEERGSTHVACLDTISNLTLRRASLSRLSTVRSSSSRQAAPKPRRSLLANQRGSYRVQVVSPFYVYFPFNHKRWTELDERPNAPYFACVAAEGNFQCWRHDLNNLLHKASQEWRHVW